MCNTSHVNISSLSCDQNYGHTLSRVFSIGVSVCFICLILGGIIFNTILIYTIVCRRILYDTSNVFMVSLSVCDLITASLTVPFDTDFILSGHYNHGPILCGLKETMFLLSLPSSIVNLLLLTVERFAKICYPYKYTVLFTRHNVMFMLIISWSYCGVVALFPFMYNISAVHTEGGVCYINLPPHYVTYQLVVNFFTPLLCIITMNMLILRTARKHANCIEKQKNSVHVFSSGKRHVSSVTTFFSANYKAAKTIMILVGMFLVCWLSYIIIVTANVICSQCHPREIIWLGNVINYASLALNPLVYGFHNKQIRKVFIRQFVGCFKQRYDVVGTFRFVKRAASNAMLSVELDEQSSFVGFLSPNICERL